MSPWLIPLRFVADFALPPRCPGCGGVTGDDHQFCAECWGKLRFLAPPWCAGCNGPFAYDRGDDAFCPQCLADPPDHAGIHAAVAYGEVARTVALRLKYGGRTALAETVGRQMARLMPADAALLIPVPLHRWRLWSRGFNQAALIAHALTIGCDVPNDPLLLRRVRPTPPLRGMGAKARARAVAGGVSRGRSARPPARQDGRPDRRHLYQRRHHRCVRTRPLARGGREGLNPVLGARPRRRARRSLIDNTALHPHL